MSKTLTNFFNKFLEKLKSLINSNGGKTILSSIVSIIIGLVIGLVVMIVMALINKDNSLIDAFKGIGIVASGPFSARTKANLLRNTGDMIFYAVPLIMTGLSVGITYKTGLFNIGAAGQFVMGTLGSLLVALSISSSLVVAVL